ncbi:M15 family metallopeptidase [Labilithrix luteola]|uniref:M15 family metallopeptidase n=1 Tax=Labilithrix luteola TaxID=1391654 RepID=UPI001F0A2B6D
MAPDREHESNERALVRNCDRHRTAASNYWEWEKKPDGSFTWKNSIPQAIVDAFESERFIWGGRWAHFDTMHFEYRPELFDPDCAP